MFVMKKFTFIIVFSLCSYSWITASGSGSHTVEVQPGKEASLQCTRKSDSVNVEFWMRQINRTEVHCVSVVAGRGANPKYCEGFDSGRFNMSTTSSTLSLKINNGDLSDSGLYICGFYGSGAVNFSVISVQVKGSSDPHDDTHSECENKSDETATLMIGILGGLTIVLVLLIIGLVVKIRKLQTANKEDHHPQPAEESHNVTYAAVEIRPKGRRRAPEPNVIYAQTR